MARLRPRDLLINSCHWLISPLRDQQPAVQLIRRTAREQWKLLSLILFSNFAIALTEGVTLGLIYLAVEVLNPAHQGYRGLGLALAAALDRFPAPMLFVGLMILAFAAQVLQSLASYLNQVTVAFFAARCQVNIFSLIHRRILAFSFPCASRYQVGDLTTHLNYGPGAVSTQISIVNDLAVGSLMFVIYLFVLVRLSPWLLITALLLGFIMAIVQKRLLPKIRRAARMVSDISVEVSSRSIEDIQGLRLLHTSGQLRQASESLHGPLQAMERSLRQRAKVSKIIDPFSRLLPVLAFVLIAILSVVVFGGRTSGVLPSLLTFMLALQRLNTRLSGIAVSTNALADNAKNFQRLNYILGPAGKEMRRLGGTPFHGLQRDIRFEQVSLRYTPDLPTALENISFSLPKGFTLALVGTSGAGKSSIADLLVGLYSPTSGRILIDDIDLETIELSSWQQRLGVVSQDTFLFNRSLADNISFGCPWATTDDVVRAATRAQAAGFIAQLPDGYNTMIGERGYRLSGGQRQRISLARALLRQPELLILDEATSALDSESERLVQEAIESFEGQQTVLVIAHRLSTIMNADEILVLENGRLVEHGTHRQLLNHAGRYNQLWMQQSVALPPHPQPLLH